MNDIDGKLDSEDDAIIIKEEVQEDLLLAEGQAEVEPVSATSAQRSPLPGVEQQTVS